MKKPKIIKGSKTVLNDWILHSVTIQSELGETFWYKMPFSPYMCTYKKHSATINLTTNSCVIAIYRPTRLGYPRLFSMEFMLNLDDALIKTHNALIHLSEECACTTEVAAGLSGGMPCKSCQAYLETHQLENIF